MTEEVKYCFDDEEIAEVARNMGDIQVRRLPVVNRDKRLVGILSLCDVAAMQDGAATAEALNRISRPGGGHSQTGWRRHPHARACAQSVPRPHGRRPDQGAPRA